MGTFDVELPMTGIKAPVTVLAGLGVVVTVFSATTPPPATGRIA